MIFKRYALILNGPSDVSPAETVEALTSIPGLLREAEENLTIMLPQDFHVTIVEVETEEDE